MDGVPDFSTIIAQQLQNLLPTILAQVGNQGSSKGDNRNRNGNVVNKDIQEKMELVQDMSGYVDDQKVMYTAGSFVGKALMWWNSQFHTRGHEVAIGMTWDDFKILTREEFCLVNEMQKLEIKFWNHVMVRAGHTAYTNRFHEFARLVTHLVTPKNKRFERYVYGLAPQIRGMVGATERKTIQKAVQLAGALTDEALRNGSIKKNPEKRKNVGEPSKDRNVRDDNKRTGTGNVFATTTNPVGTENMGTVPKRTTCNSHHAPGAPCRTCFNCNRPSHFAKDCRVMPRNVNNGVQYGRIKFVKDNVTISDSFLAIRGTWVSSSTKLLIVTVYAPQDFSKRKILWDYIAYMIQSWEGECVIFGDFNKVRFEHERFGTYFNDSCANAFNHFILSAGLNDLPLEEGLLSEFPSLSSFCLDRNLSDHRPIIMHENVVDYGPSPFHFFHSWFNKYGFDKIVEDVWKNSAIMETNKISLLKKKLQNLKSVIKAWCKEDKKNSNEYRFSMQSWLSELDKLFDKGKSTDALVIERSSLLKSLQDLNARHSLEMAQKAKIRWAIEGDENTKYFHGIINKKRSQLAIRGVLVNGDWIQEPSKVKDEFLNHFANRFSKPDGPCMTPDASLFKQISFDQNVDLESDVNYEEIKRAVWDCG
ncbi:RNA-directed DNA polymerase, eukaryota, partial [Tanacetum coccineum]